MCYIPHSRTCRLETNFTASRSSTRVCSEVTPNTPQVSLQDSVAPQSTSVRLFGKGQLSTLQHIVLELRALNHFPPPRTSQDHAPALGGRVLFQCSHRASHRRPSLLVRSASFKVHSCTVTHRRLHFHILRLCQCSIYRTKERRIDSGLQTKQEHCQVGHER